MNIFVLFSCLPSMMAMPYNIIANTNNIFKGIFFISYQLPEPLLHNWTLASQ